MIKILHTSDLHGSYSTALDVLEPFDLWIDSGDFFPNKTRGHRETEERFQADWMREENIQAKVFAWLRGRPMLSVGGNHDFISLSAMLWDAGVDAHRITPGGVSLSGFRFAGFSDIPWIAGEWNGETHDLSGVVAATFQTPPDVLVTHAPPAGVLDTYAGRSVGIGPLMSALCWNDHNIRAHFFGHVHDGGGKTTEEAGVYFANGANRARVHVIESG